MRTSSKVWLAVFALNILVPAVLVWIHALKGLDGDYEMVGVMHVVLAVICLAVVGIKEGW